MSCSATRTTSAASQSGAPYHALLGRPALAKFMMVPHYAYLKAKMPSPKGIITLASDYKKFLECAAARSRLAESLIMLKISVSLTEW